MRPVLAFLEFVGESSIIFGDAVQRAPRRPVEWREAIVQMAFVGVASVPIVVLTSFFSGAVLALYLTSFLRQYGAQSFVGATVGLTAAREIGPVIAGIMVSARAGGAMAAQIGTMADTEQIDALRMLGVHPTNYLVIPRLIAAILMVPILALVAIWMAILGGMIVADAEGLSATIFLQSVQQYVTPKDLVNGIAKGPFFGLIVALVACQQGLRTKNGAVGVGRATTNAVVVSMVAVYVANFLLARVMYR